MKITVTPTGKTFSVDVVRDDGTWIDGYELVEAHEVEDVRAKLKRDCYDVKSLLEELPIESSCELVRMYDQVTERYGIKYTHKRFVYTYTFKRPVKYGSPYTRPVKWEGEPFKARIAEISVQFETGDGEAEPSLVLEWLIDDGYSVQAYSEVRSDISKFSEWASDLDYGRLENGIRMAREAWDTSWDNWEKIQEIITPEEFVDIKHAFEEGRRR